MDINQLYEQRTEGKKEALSSMRDYTKELTDLKEGFKAGDTSGTFMFDYAKKKQEGFASMEDLTSLRNINKGAAPTSERDMGALFDRLKFQQAAMTGARKTVDERLHAFAGEAKALEGEAAFKQQWWKEDVTEKRQKEQHSMSIASQAQSIRLRAESNKRAQAAADAKSRRDRILAGRADEEWRQKQLKWEREEELYNMSPEDRKIRKARNSVNEKSTGEESEDTLNLLLENQQLFNDYKQLPKLSPTRRGVVLDQMKANKEALKEAGETEALKGQQIEQGAMLVDEFYDKVDNWLFKPDAEDIAKAVVRGGAATNKKDVVEEIQSYLDYEKNVRETGMPKSYFDAKVLTRSYHRQDSDKGETGGFTDVTSPGEASILHTENNLEAVRNLTEDYVYSDKEFTENVKQSVSVPATIYKGDLELDLGEYSEDINNEEYDEFWDKAVNEKGELVQLDETNFSGLTQSLAQQYNIKYNEIKDSLDQSALNQAAESEIILSDIKYFTYGMMPEGDYKDVFGEKTYNQMSSVTGGNKYVNIAAMNNSLNELKDMRSNTNLDSNTSYMLENGIAMLENRTVADAMGLEDPNGYIMQERPDLFGDINYELLNTPINQLSEEQIYEIGNWQGLVTGQDKSMVFQNPVAWDEIEKYEKAFQLEQEAVKLADKALQ